MRTAITLMAMVGIGGLVALGTGCGSTEKYEVTISYVLEPTKALPEGLQTVAILDSGVEMEGPESDEREKKWSKLAADMMESMIQKQGDKVKVVSRRQTDKVLGERDLALAGLVSGGEAAQAAKLLNAQALITSQLNIIVETKTSKRTTFDLTSLAGGGGHGWGWGGGTIGAREADEIARSMTLQCKFSMLDAGTGEAIIDYAPRPFRKTDHKKPSAVFGQSTGEASLDPLGPFINELIEQSSREFISTFIPVEVEFAVELESSTNKNSAQGIRLLRQDEFELALQSFKAAVAEKPDDHRSVFCMAVTCELMGNWDDALKHYKQAAGMPDLSDDDIKRYVAAKDRVNEHKDRIRKKS